MDTCILFVLFAAGATSVLAASLFPTSPEFRPETGTWSAWERWGSCSATCGPGYRTRRRNCEKKASESNGLSNMLPLLLSQLTESGGAGNILPFFLLGDGTPDMNMLLMLMLASQNDNSTSSSTSLLTDILPLLSLTDKQGSAGMNPLLMLLLSGAFGSNSTMDPILLISLMNGMGGQDMKPPNCIGDETDTKPCYEEECVPVSCIPQWGPWGGCSATCGYAIITRQMVACNCPPGAYGECAGPKQETRPCRNIACATPTPVVVTCVPRWGPWGPCSATCGYSTKVRSRVACNCPGGAYGKCEGPDHQSTSCGFVACSSPTPAPVPCIPQWGTWGPCSATCGHSTMSRLRINCKCPFGSYGTCEGPKQETTSCSYIVCPTPGIEQWGPWSKYGDCMQSSKANGCYRSRKRNCLGTGCTEPFEQSIECTDCELTPPATKSCDVRTADKKDCGVHGITYLECMEKGCCFDNSERDVPWCFFKA